MTATAFHLSSEDAVTVKDADDLVQAVRDFGLGLDQGQFLYTASPGGYGRRTGAKIMTWARQTVARRAEGHWILISKAGHAYLTCIRRHALSTWGKPHGATLFCMAYKIVDRAGLDAAPASLKGPNRRTAKRKPASSSPTVPDVDPADLNINAVSHCPHNGCASVAMSAVTGIPVEEWQETVAEYNRTECGRNARTAVLYRAFSFYASLGLKRVPVNNVPDQPWLSRWTLASLRRSGQLTPGVYVLGVTGHAIAVEVTDSGSWYVVESGNLSPVRFRDRCKWSCGDRKVVRHVHLVPQD